MKEKEEKEAERQRIRLEMKGKKWKSSRLLQKAVTVGESVVSSEPRQSEAPDKIMVVKPTAFKYSDTMKTDKSMEDEPLRKPEQSDYIEQQPMLTAKSNLKTPSPAGATRSPRLKVKI